MSDEHFTAAHIPPVCGFNLLEKFTWNEEHPRGRRFREWDFDFLAGHGFRFARLPMDYRCWTRDLDGPRTDIDESVLAEVAEAVAMGKARGIHVCVNIHRGPGYCINKPEIEPFNLWTDEPAREAFAAHWRALAECLAGFTSDECSFDLLNEPPGYGGLGFTAESHREVMARAAGAIREVSPDRLIICDGNGGGHWPSPELRDLGVAQSMRGYIPFEVTHHQASWCGRGDDYVWPAPAWPMDVPGEGKMCGVWDRARLAADVYLPWRELEAQGVGVHCGELGVYSHTPPEVTYAFLDDLLSIFNANGWGWALWNLRGAFGPIDNGRAGTQTEPCGGHHLDRQMLDLLKRRITKASPPRA